jgi:hypothetical protein
MTINGNSQIAGNSNRLLSRFGKKNWHEIGRGAPDNIGMIIRQHFANGTNVMAVLLNAILKNVIVCKFLGHSFLVYHEIGRRKMPNARINAAGRIKRSIQAIE